MFRPGGAKFGAKRRPRGAKRRAILGGSGGMLPRKILKSRLKSVQSGAILRLFLPYSLERKCNLNLLISWRNSHFNFCSCHCGERGGGGYLPQGSGHAPRQFLKSRLKSELFRCYFYLLHRTKRLSKFADFWKKYATVGRGGCSRGSGGQAPRENFGI